MTDGERVGINDGKSDIDHRRRRVETDLGDFEEIQYFLSDYHIYDTVLFWIQQQGKKQKQTKTYAFLGLILMKKLLVEIIKIATRLIT